MASPNAGPITGSELIRAVQGDQTVWLTRAQVVQLLTLQSRPARNRPFGQRTGINGGEGIDALQGGARISMNAADFQSYLLKTTAIPQAVPANRQPTNLTGEEYIVGLQGGVHVGFTVADAVTINNGAAPINAAINSFAVMGNSLLPDGTDAANGNGWVATVTVPDDGVSTFDPTKITLTTSQGRTIKGRKIVRQQQPNQANLLNLASGGVRTLYISLDKTLASTETIATATAAAGFYGAAAAGTIAGATNGSTRAYPRGYCAWLNIQHERVTADFPVELYAFHRLRKITRVDFYAKDASGNTTSTISVTTRSISSFCTQGNPPEVFKATIPVASLNQGDIAQVYAKIYDDLGNLVLDLETQGIAWPTARPQTPLRVKIDKTGAYGGAVAYVKAGASGGTVGSRATPYPTTNAAITALQTFNGANKGHTDTGGATIYLMDDGAGGAVTHVHSSVTATAGQSWLDIKPDPLNTAAVKLAAAATSTMPAMTRFQVEVTSAGGTTVFDGGPAGKDGMYAFEAPITYTGTSTNFPLNYRMGLCYFRNVTVTGITQSAQTPFQVYASTQGRAALILGCLSMDTTVSADISPFAIIGSRFARFRLTDMTSTATGVETNDGFLIANCEFTKFGSNSAMAIGSNFDYTLGFAIVQTYMENIIGGGAPPPLIRIVGDSMSHTVLNGCVAYCNFIGRYNRGYTDDTTDVGLQKEIFELFTIWWIGAKKSDNFIGKTSVTGRTGNWVTRYAVDSMGNVSRSYAVNPSLNGSINVLGALGNQWLGDDMQGVYDVSNVTFVNDLSSSGDVGVASTTGGGNYRLTGTNNDAYNLVPAGAGLLERDLDNALRRTDGTGAAGPYERTV